MEGNFYSLRFKPDSFLPFIRQGIKVKLKNNILYLNGVCLYNVVNKPQERDPQDLNLNNMFFLYPNNVPWIAKENDGNFYLYKGSIDKDSLNLGFDISEDTCYMSAELKKEGGVSVSSGRIISRIFEEDKQTCIIEIKKDATIIIDQSDLVTIIEWDGKKFVCG